MASSAIPTTAAERARRAQILESAEALLAEEGETGLHMKVLAQRSGVAIATLYRYFPSKDHVLGAIAVARHERALERIDRIALRGDTPGEQVGDLFLREFRAVQRTPDHAAALQRVANAPDRATSEYLEALDALLERTILAVLGRGGAEVRSEHRLLIPIVIAATETAMTHWLAGMLSAKQARERIRTVTRLLDLPADVVREHLVRAGRD